MSEISESTATLRIFGDELDPGTITSRLGREPTTSCEQGEEIERFGVRRKASQGKWCLETALERDRQPHEHIEWLLHEVQPGKDLWNELVTRFSVDIFVGLFLESVNEGFELPRSLLTRVSDYPVAIGFDVYYVGKDS